jgi:hypothetical protein
MGTTSADRSARLLLVGRRERTHDLEPWTGYFLGILSAAYREFESRAGVLVGRGSKKALITTFIDSLLADEFMVAQVRQAAPGVSDAHISKVAGPLEIGPCCGSFDDP